MRAAPHLINMSHSWLLDHVAVLERTIARLRDEGTSRAEHLLKRYDSMLTAARLKLERRAVDDAL